MSVDRIIQVLKTQGGAGSRRQLKDAGCSRRTIDALVRQRELVAVRQDALVLGQALAGATPWARNELEARAVGFSLASSVGQPAGQAAAGTSGTSGPAYALSHESALMIHGLPYFGEDGLIHLVRTDGQRGRRDGTIWVHRPCDEEWVEDVDGLRVMVPVLAALQVAATHGAEAGLVALDGVLHHAQQHDLEETGRGDGPACAGARGQVAAALALTWGSGLPTVRLVAELADGRAESAGESRSRWLLRELGLGPTTPQFRVHDGPDLVGLADLKLDRWDVLVEFDGTGKYSDPGALVAEKDREDRMRTLGYEVVRIRWADLSRPHLVRQRVLAAIARAEARATGAG